jgi:S-adenosylmethionine:tRNA ribosyltransferase-isomerase
MRLDDFDFALPRALIADRPCEPRDAARLLVIPASGGFADRRIADLPELLRPGDLLVFNDTKVIPARFVGRRGAASIEVTLYRDLGGGAWRAFSRGAPRLSRAFVWPPIIRSQPATCRAGRKTPPMG